MEIIMLPAKVGARRKEVGSVVVYEWMWYVWFGCVVWMCDEEVRCGCAEKRKMRSIQADADQSLIWYANFYFLRGISSLKEEFERMTFDQKVSYLLANRNELPDELALDGVKMLAQAGEIEYAVVLARDKGMIDKAIQILVDAGDYLWAAMIAKNANRDGESENLYREGLQYYIDMEMFGHAISAATALGLPPRRSRCTLPEGN